MPCYRSETQACDTAATVGVLTDAGPVFPLSFAWVSIMQKLKSLLEGIYSAQNVFCEVSSGKALASLEPSATRKGHNKRTPADAGVLEYRYLVEGFPSGRSLANCRKFTAIT